jgi:hypothetical protein
VALRAKMSPEADVARMNQEAASLLELGLELA